MMMMMMMMMKMMVDMFEYFTIVALDVGLFMA